MALEISNQYLYTARGPFDAKSLVETYNELLEGNAWLTAGGYSVAYNGMIVAVWNNTVDPSKNGVYYLHDSTVTNTFVAPNVAKEENWHKLVELDQLDILSSRLAALEQRKLFKRIYSEDELPKVGSDNFDANVTYYQDNGNDGYLTFIFDEDLQNYICTSTADTSRVNRFEINKDGQLLVYYSNGEVEILGSVVGKDGSTLSVKVGEILYTPTDGVVTLPDLATKEELAKLETRLDSVVSSSVPKKVSELENDVGYITEVPDNYITEEEFSTFVLFGGNATTTREDDVLA